MPAAQVKMKTNQEGHNDEKSYIQFSASPAVGRYLHLNTNILIGG